MSDTEQPKKPDYLEVDEAIPGQNYVCLSFLSPESLMQNKEAFKCVKFLQSYCKDQKLKWFSGSLEDAFLNQDNKIIMVDFYTDWCIPCKQIDSETFIENI